MEEYNREFEKLLMRCDLQENDSQTFVRYLFGLNYQIANTVELQPFDSLKELTKLALKVEAQLKKSKSSLNCSNSTYQISSNSTPPTVQTPTPLLPQSNKTVHPISTPNTPPLSKPSSSNSRVQKSFRCQGMGHYASECPNMKIMTIVECEEDEINPSWVKEESKEEEIFFGPDEGELLVIQKTISHVAAQDDHSHRESIFHTRCTIEKRVCSMIIDSGSSANVVSKTTVEKLQLETMRIRSLMRFNG